MSKQQYLWMLGLITAWRQQVDGDDQEGQGLLLQAIYAQAGVFDNAPAKSANDQMAAFLILLFILWWNCAKYRAQIGVFAQSHTSFFQNIAAPFFSDYLAESRTTPSLPNAPTVFSHPPRQCQMNNTLTIA